ncbi:MFS transporter [Mycobacterium sp. CBMA 234]|uniref:MFS transporter n=1 Tax=Mycolicibacterium sp. CBMA 234 TaxID=1918495 RepID=UPI00139123D6|nr:MFS transporter [Mycolicibacterium sp. CBMA 234]MUL67031.1 MFS transporter [Mycolicibacterium sp. CBMA 234]
MTDRPHHIVLRAVQALPDFRRLLELRAVSQFGDGLFQAGLVGALLFSPDRAATPWAIAGSFAVLFLPYSLLGPFAGALLDRWDRRQVLIVANVMRLLLMIGVGALLATGAADLPILFGALIINGFTRFVSSGLSAALPHVVPTEQVVSMNSVATAVGALAAFVGANVMLLPRWLMGAGDASAAVVIWLAALPVALALWLSVRFHRHLLGPDDSVRAVHGSVTYAVVTGWVYGIRSVVNVPTVTATLAGLAAHRMVFGINTLMVLVMVRHGSGEHVAGFKVAVVFVAAAGIGSFLANVVMPAAVRRWGRYTTANGALAISALVQLSGSGLQLPVLLVCSLVLGTAGQVVKLCADSAMQLDVDDALRGHVFAVQDSLFWMAFILAITVAAAVIPADGRSSTLMAAGAAVYLGGLALHATLGKRTRTGGTV